MLMSDTVEVILKLAVLDCVQGLVLGLFHSTNILLLLLLLDNTTEEVVLVGSWLAPTVVVPQHK